MKDVAQVIECLGGTKAVATALGVVPSAVRNWRRLKAFPLRLHLPLSALARARGIAVDDALFRELSGPDRAA